MPYRLLLAALTLLALAAPAAAFDFSLPELVIQPSGTCRTLAVRDRTSNAMVPLGCLDTAGKGFVPAGNASGMGVAPNATAAAGSLAHALALPTMVRGLVLDPVAAPKSGDYASLVVQNSSVDAATMIAPQLPPGHNKGENVRSVMVVPDGTTTGTNSAFGYYVRNDSTADAVGVFGTTICNRNYGSCWGSNPTLIDNPVNGVDTSATNLGRILVGSELDVQVTSRDTTVSGYNCTGASGVQPKAATCFQVGQMFAANPSRGIKWSYGLTIDNATSTVALLVGADALSGATVGSMPVRFNLFDKSGTVQAVQVQATGLGGLNVSRTDAANGVSLLPALAGQFPSIQAYGKDANTGLVVKAQGVGQVVTQSLLNAAKGLYVSTSATFAAPVKLSVYTVASLPACNAASAFSMAAVTDAVSPTYNGALTGGGIVPIPVFCRGDVWLAH